MEKENTEPFFTAKNFAKIDDHQHKLLQEFGKPHIDSFDYFVEVGLANAVKKLQVEELVLRDGTILKFNICNAVIRRPCLPPQFIGTGCVVPQIYPQECRLRGSTYNGDLDVELQWSMNDVAMPNIKVELSRIPIMLKSSLCNLRNLSPEKLVKRGEHEDEWGGYFVVRGRERIIRMLLNTRRNYPIVMQRGSWKSMNPKFTDLGVFIRSVADDESSIRNILHYVSDGTAKLMFSIRRMMFYCPIILIMRCLVDFNDQQMFQYIIKGFEDDDLFKNCIVNMMRESSDLRTESILNQQRARNYMGDLFRVRLFQLPIYYSDEDVCHWILKNSILPHLDDYFDKFMLLVFMLQKLYSASKDKVVLENPDAIMFQELSLSGHMYLQVLKEKLAIWLNSIKLNIMKQENNNKKNKPFNEDDFKKHTRKTEMIKTSIESFLATGNISGSNSDVLQQDKGLTIMAENISMVRYMSHFRGVHRGSKFDQMRSTEPRQLLPDAWGFICPVHTPDGHPCGLLNHLSRTCQVSTQPSEEQMKSIPKILSNFGMIPLTESSLMSDLPKKMNKQKPSRIYVIQLDGRIIGHTYESIAQSLVDKLRKKKIDGVVPTSLEIVFLKFSENDLPIQYPGIYLFSSVARMIRPVRNLRFDKIELIGTFEQVYLNVAITPEEIVPGVTTHVELDKGDFLSFAASLIPMPDYNQSPRNMYQCQMAKQTMGTPCHNFMRRSDTKLYRLMTPTTPLFRPIFHDKLKMDNFAMGTNAIVAVVSYTGFDMEDAMIINKSSVERGFAQGAIYKTEIVDLDKKQFFAIDPNRDLRGVLDRDGLAFVGQKLTNGDIMYSFYNEETGKFFVGKYKGKEDVVIEAIRACSSYDKNEGPVDRASFLLRVTRNPIVGDKFASRAGQKGIFSVGFHTEDMPFTESGMVPDIVFNPHGFPSRMTIAMMIEMLAGKSAAIEGKVYDATPFRMSEDETPIEKFGELLMEKGFTSCGEEYMYSGTKGTLMESSIFFGIVHYQRLRHMVSDKYQVRSTGTVDIITHQPIKGRKRGGGGRVGEMERDALIAHGGCHLVFDRLIDNSDKSVAEICTQCSSLIGPTTLEELAKDGYNVKRSITVCLLCNSDKHIKTIGIPYIFKYLSAELASVGIRLKFNITNDGRLGGVSF